MITKKFTPEQLVLMGMTVDQMNASGFTDAQALALLGAKTTDKGVSSDLAAQGGDVQIPVKDIEDLHALVEEIKNQKTLSLEGVLSDEAFSGKVTELVKGLLASQQQAAQRSKMIFDSSSYVTNESLDVLRKAVKLPAGKVRNEMASRALTYPATDERVKALQKASDDMLLIDAVLRCSDPNYRRSGDIKGLKAYKKFAAIRDEITKAIAPMDTTDTAEWVPTGLSSNVLDLPLVIGQLEGLFQHIYMPTNPYKFPLNLNGADTLPTLVAEIGTVVNPFDDTVGQTITDGVMTFTAAKMRSRLMASAELDEDAIVPLLPLMKRELKKILDNGAEAAYLNGDTTATHFDTDIHALGATDCRKAFIGLRKYLLAAGSSDLVQSLATFSFATVMGVKGKAGKYGINPNEAAWITGIQSYIGKLLQLEQVITLEKYGPGATVLTGELAKLAGSPVIISEHQREDVDETGVNGADDNDHATLIYVNRNYFFIGDKREITVDAEKLLNTDQYNVVAFRRFDFEPLATPSATYTLGGIGINFNP